MSRRLSRLEIAFWQDPADFLQISGRILPKICGKSAGACQKFVGKWQDPAKTRFQGGLASWILPLFEVADARTDRCHFATIFWQDPAIFAQKNGRILPICDFKAAQPLGLAHFEADLCSRSGLASGRPLPGAWHGRSAAPACLAAASRPVFTG